MARPRGALRRDLRLSLGDAAGYGVMAGAGELYLPAFGLAIGMSPVLAGLVATVPLLAGGVLQLAAPRAIARVPSYRGWVVGCQILQALAFLPLIALAAWGGPATPIVFLCASLYWAAGMGATAGWSSWVCRIVPARVRGRFLGRRQAVAQSTLLLSLLTAGFLLDGADDTHAVYAGMFAASAAGRLVSAFLMSRQGAGVDATPRGRVRLRSLPPRVRGTTRGALLLYLVAALSAAALAGPFITPFLLVEQRIGYAGYTLYVAVVVVAKVIALPTLGRLVSRIGAKRLLTISAFAIAPLPLLWPVSPSLWWLLSVQVIGGIAWAGFDVGMLMTLFSADDENERTTLQVAFSGMQAIGTAGASLLGGLAFTGLGGDRDAYLIVFALSAAARVAAVVLLVQQLPRLLFAIPTRLAVGAWVMAIRPWGGTILRPFVEGLGRFRRPRD